MSQNRRHKIGIVKMTSEKRHLKKINNNIGLDDYRIGQLMLKMMNLLMI